MIHAIILFFITIAAADDVVGDSRLCRLDTFDAGSTGPIWTPDISLNCSTVEILPVDEHGVGLGAAKMITVDAHEMDDCFGNVNYTYYATVPAIQDHGLFKLTYLCNGFNQPFCQRLQISPTDEPDEPTATKWAVQRKCFIGQAEGVATSSGTWRDPTTLVTATSLVSTRVSTGVRETETSRAENTRGNAEGTGGTETSGSAEGTGGAVATGGAESTSGTKTTDAIESMSGTATAGSAAGTDGTAATDISTSKQTPRSGDASHAAPGTTEATLAHSAAASSQVTGPASPAETVAVGQERACGQ